MEHSAVIRPNFFGFQVAIKDDYLYALPGLLGFPGVVQDTLKKELVQMETGDAMAIHRKLVALCTDDEINPEILEVEIPSMNIRAIANASGISGKKDSSSRDLAFKKALEFILDNLDRSFSVSELSKAVGMSERSLRYIFYQKTQVSPKRFIQHFKLNMVRKELKLRQSDKLISSLASQWGFWHSGQFAADYKKLFGELPSETASS